MISWIILQAQLARTVRRAETVIVVLDSPVRPTSPAVTVLDKYSELTAMAREIMEERVHLVVTDGYKYAEKASIPPVPEIKLPSYPRDPGKSRDQKRLERARAFEHSRRR